MTKAAALTWLEQHPEVDYVTVALADINGIFRGKRIPLSQVEPALDGKLRLPISACTVDIWGRDIEDSELVFESGDCDGICSVTDRGIIPQIWGDKTAAFMQVSLTTENGARIMTDPRQALAHVVDKYKAAGLTPVVATELEFYLMTVDGNKPRRLSLPDEAISKRSESVLSISELDALSPFFDDVYAACAAQNIPADSAISEGGLGQLEINLLHTDDPLKAADDAILFKSIVRGVAKKHDYVATFMAKPFGDQPGNGFHVHFSLLDEAGKNIFDDGSLQGSEKLKHAVGGLLEAMPESTLVFAPHQNSYRRMRPDSHAPISIAWGYENRTCAIRIPGGSKRARRIEHRVSGADANPYLVLAAILGGALHGMENKTVPCPPLVGNSYESDSETLPLDWATAIEAFENGAVMKTVFDPVLHRLFAQAKRQELSRFLGIVTEAEYVAYLETV